MSIACPDFIAALDPALCRAVDHYCERTGPALDAEPVNAITNAAFLHHKLLTLDAKKQQIDLSEIEIPTIDRDPFDRLHFDSRNSNAILDPWEADPRRPTAPAAGAAGSASSSAPWPAACFSPRPASRSSSAT